MLLHNQFVAELNLYNHINWPELQHIWRSSGLRFEAKQSLEDMLDLRRTRTSGRRIERSEPWKKRGKRTTEAYKQGKRDIAVAWSDYHKHRKECFLFNVWTDYLFSFVHKVGSGIVGDMNAKSEPSQQHSEWKEPRSDKPHASVEEVAM